MVVIFEFLGTEPIENVITCMHYKVDKVVYFGYPEVIDSLEKSTDAFLKGNCGVSHTVYHPMPKDDLQSILKSMRKAIEYELGQKNSIYFDITGGESLILVAFGMLSTEYRTPIHLFDVVHDRILELDEGAKHIISKDVPEKRQEERTLDIEGYIKLWGASINNAMHKGVKGINSEEEDRDVVKLWSVADKHWEYWNPFSGFLRDNFSKVEGLEIRTSAARVLDYLEQSESKLKHASKLNEILDDLEEIGALEEVVHGNGTYKFRIKNKFIKDCLWDGGSILELHVYRQEKPRNYDCRVGVHIDWDGEIKYPEGNDVLNEIDVMTIQDNIPTFISCKGGNTDGKKALPPLYELETVARRFGGKYAKKVLVVKKPLGAAYQERADEMGIEVRVE